MRNMYSEIMISNYTGDEQLNKIARRLVSEFNAKIIRKVNNSDSLYWDFKIDSEIITLHQQIFIGITIFPKELANATIKANRIVEEIGLKLK